MADQRIVGTPANDLVRNRRRKEPFESRKLRHLRHLFGDSGFELDTPSLQLLVLRLNLIKQTFDPQQRTDARGELDTIDRLLQKVIGPLASSPRTPS